MRAHAAHTHGLESVVLEAIPLEELAAVLGQRVVIGAHEPVDPLILIIVLRRMENERRLVDDPAAPVHHLTDFREQVFGHRSARLGGDLLAALAHLGIGRCGDQHLVVDAGIPGVEDAHRRELAQPRTIRVGQDAHHRLTTALRDAVLAAGHDEAGSQPLDVPFPGRGQGLVEIVQVEDQVALGRGKEAEVRQVAVPARLHEDAAGRGGRQIARHHRRRSAEERERARQHAAVADGDQLGHAAQARCFEHVDGVAAVGRRLPIAVRAWRLLRRLAHLAALAVETPSSVGS